MSIEQKGVEVAEHAGYLYEDPEGKTEIDLSDLPSFDTIEAEAAWQQSQLAYRFVAPIEGGWDKEKLLAAIKDGHIDAFSKNSVRFPPVPEGTWYDSFTTYYFDDRDFGDRLANTVLQGFNREPRTT
ncbi:MAG TPA: hypothetical protein VMR34_02965 [Candidatus Saccharimonadales bacterium]|nr:hypothetical protein [Candidatus Saccharimonadales bacterium]